MDRREAKQYFFSVAGGRDGGVAMRHRGIHHVTAIAGPARRNLDFYRGALGLRLVKKTVNFDDPGTYHLYYGDGAGDPGTILTFFPWERSTAGSLGVGVTQEKGFGITAASIGDWSPRFIDKGGAPQALV